MKPSERPVAAPHLIRLAGVYKIYGMGDAETRALNGVDLSIKEGEFLAVMGSSGSGKSTCINILGCLDSPTRGRYDYRGHDVSRLQRDDLALIRRHEFGFVFQSFNLLPRTSALENVEVPLVYKGLRKSKRRELAMGQLERVGLADRAHHTSAELSGGQQQRVAIARALVGDPSTIFADEPTGNLDSKNTDDILELLLGLHEQRGITVVLVTHEAGVARRAPRVLWFHDGVIANDGAPDEVIP